MDWPAYFPLSQNEEVRGRRLSTEDHSACPLVVRKRHIPGVSLLRFLRGIRSQSCDKPSSHHAFSLPFSSTSNRKAHSAHEKDHLLIQRSNTTFFAPKSSKQLAPILEAAEIGDSGTLVDALSTSKSLEETDADGATAAILASSKGHLPCVCALAEAGADFTAATTGGFTALHYAARGGHIDVVKFLLKLPRVDPNAREYTRKWTPMHFAMLKKHAEVVQVLRADKRVSESMGGEAFDVGAWRSDFRIVSAPESA